MKMESKGKRNGSLAIAAVLGAFAAPQALAQAGDFASASVHSFYAFAGGAAFVHQQNDGLQNEQNSFAGAMVGGGFRTSPNLAVELAWLLGGHELDTPSTALPTTPFTAGTQKSTIATAGIAATAKYNFTAGRFMPYAGGGMGWYSTQFRTTTEAVGCTNKCNDSGPRVTADSKGLGYHVMVGADYHFTPKDVFGTELRYLKLDAKFGDVVPGKVNAGGTFLWLGYRRVFR